MGEGTLYLVSTPIGNRQDISARALETLGRVARVYAEDTRHTSPLLRHFGVATPVRSLHEHNEAARTLELLEVLSSGESCALVSDAGTPAVSDPGARVVAAVAEAGHPIVPIPGASAVLASIVVSGLPADRFAFVGFPPRKTGARSRWMEEVQTLTMTVVAFESPRRLSALLGEWDERGLGERRCVVCRELTKLHEEVRRGTVASLAHYYRDMDVRGEVSVVLEGRSVAGGSVRDAALGEARRVVGAMVREGRSTRDIVRRLQADFGMTRNEAYELALETPEPS